MEMGKHLVRNLKPSQAINKNGTRGNSPISNKMRFLTIPETTKVNIIIFLTRFSLNEFSYLSKRETHIIRMMRRAVRGSTLLSKCMKINEFYHKNVIFYFPFY